VSEIYSLWSFRLTLALNRLKLRTRRLIDLVFPRINPAPNLVGDRFHQHKCRFLSDRIILKSSLPAFNPIPCCFQ